VAALQTLKTVLILPFDGRGQIGIVPGLPFFRHLKEVTSCRSPAVFTSSLAVQRPESLPSKLIDRIGGVVVGQFFSFRDVSECINVIHCYRFHLEVTVRVTGVIHTCSGGVFDDVFAASHIVGMISIQLWITLNRALKFSQRVLLKTSQVHVKDVFALLDVRGGEYPETLFRGFSQNVLGHFDPSLAIT
jgi:hypothetical protein